jgi:hypothetical protein
MMFSKFGVLVFGLISFIVLTLLVAYGARLEEKIGASEKEKEKK